MSVASTIDLTGVSNPWLHKGLRDKGEVEVLVSQLRTSIGAIEQAMMQLKAESRSITGHTAFLEMHRVHSQRARLGVSRIELRWRGTDFLPRLWAEVKAAADTYPLPLMKHYIDMNDRARRLNLQATIARASLVHSVEYLTVCSLEAAHCFEAVGRVKRKTGPKRTAERRSLLPADIPLMK